MSPIRERPPAAPRPYALLVALVLALALVLVLAVRGWGADKRQLGYGQIKYQGLGPERWAQKWRREHRKVLVLRHRLRAEQHALLTRPNVVEAINLAAATYGYADDLWRRARCETGGSFNPLAANPGSGAAGLFQFLPSTWRSTPYARFPVWSPYANALAAGWMHSVGRGGEWACR